MSSSSLIPSSLSLLSESSAPTSSQAPGQDVNQDKKPVGTIVGGVIVGVAAFALLAALLLWLRRRARSSRALRPLKSADSFTLHSDGRTSPYPSSHSPAAIPQSHLSLRPIITGRRQKANPVDRGTPSSSDTFGNTATPGRSTQPQQLPSDYPDATRHLPTTMRSGMVEQGDMWAPTSPSETVREGEVIIHSDSGFRIPRDTALYRDVSPREMVELPPTYALN